MKKVIDANFFEQPALEQYFGADKRNKVVFTEYACMELYKPVEIEPIRRALKIVSKYPSQVIILKSTSQIIKLKSSQSGLQRRFEDSVQTEGFKEFCELVDLAARGQTTLATKLRKKAERARSQIFDVSKDPERIARSIIKLSSSFNREQLKALRKREPLTPELGRKVTHHILLLAAFLFDKHLSGREWPRFQQIRNNYVFRFATSIYLLALRWIAEGGIIDAKADTLRNDIIDMSYVAYATFFDGLLSRDKKMQTIYREARFLIDQIFTPE